MSEQQDAREAVADIVTEIESAAKNGGLEYFNTSRLQWADKILALLREPTAPDYICSGCSRGFDGIYPCKSCGYGEPTAPKNRVDRRSPATSDRSREMSEQPDAREAVAEELRLLKADVEQCLIARKVFPDEWFIRRADRILALLREPQPTASRLERKPRRLLSRQEGRP